MGKRERKPCWPATLVAMDGLGGFQIVAQASSEREARELADGYVKFGADIGDLAPEWFELHGRDREGQYVAIRIND